MAAHMISVCSKRTMLAWLKIFFALADTGYLGINKLHANSQIPAKNSKLHKLTLEQKIANRELASKRIFCEHVIGRLKVFRILSDKYRNRRKRFALRFNLIAAIYNFELSTKS